MKRILVSCVVLALIAVSADQASALGRRAHKRARTCHCCTAVTATPDVQAAPEAAAIDESAALSQVVDAMRGMLMRENDRLERKIAWYEEDQSSAAYGSD